MRSTSNFALRTRLSRSQSSPPHLYLKSRVFIPFEIEGTLQDLKGSLQQQKECSESAGLEEEREQGWKEPL